MSGSGVSMKFRGKVFHSVVVREKKLFWYDIVGLYSEVGGRTWFLIDGR